MGFKTNFFASSSQLSIYYKHIGAQDYDIRIIVKNSNELRVFINELRKNFSEGIKINDVYLILEEATGYKLPEGVFKI